MEPLVSVVIPCYNAEKSIIRTLNSVDRCGYANLEIITVNDGSRDNTGKLLDGAATVDQRIRVIHQANAGVSVARNAGVAKASSEYIAFIDADDIFFQDSISARMKVFLQEDSDALLGVFCPALLLDENLELLMVAGMFDYVLPMDRLYFSSIAGSVFNPSCVIVKKSKFIKAGGFDSSLPPAEDFELWHRMMRMGGYFRKTSDCCIGWVQHVSSATHGNRLKHFSNKKQVIGRLFSESHHEHVAPENIGGLGVCYYNDLISKTSLLDALNAAIAGQLDEAEAIAQDIAPSYLNKLDFGEFNSHLEFCSIKTLCQPEDCWPHPLWSRIRNNVFDLLGRLSSKGGKRNENVLSILEKLRNYDQIMPLVTTYPAQQASLPASLSDTIELLSTDLIDANHELAQSILRRGNELGIGLGWHYVLDLIWIINKVLLLPKSSVILDAGAGNGLLQFLLADLGYTVISADFAERTPPRGTARTHRVIEVTTGRHYENAYIQHLETEFKTTSSGREQIITDADAFQDMIKRNPSGTIYYYRTDICDLQLIQAGTIDAVVSLSALEHNQHDVFHRAIAELCRVVKTGGLLFATVSATDKTQDWYHIQSKGWCYTEESLIKLFSLESPATNYTGYSSLFAKLQGSLFLKQHLAPSYFNSGNNGMPWGRWDPQYQPVGVIKVVRRGGDASIQTTKPALAREGGAARIPPHPALLGMKISALIDTTDGCNLRCSFCSRKNSKIEMMSSADFSILVDRIRPYVDTVQLCCAWEYSIAPNAHEIVRLLGNCRFNKSTIYTNGQILPDQLALSIVEARINNLVFSIGESKKETYEKLRLGGKFERILENIAKVRDLKLRMGVQAPLLCANLTVINSNLGELPDFVDLAHRLGIAEIRGRHLILNEGLEMNDEVIRDTVLANAILDSSEQKARGYDMEFNIPRYGDTLTCKDCRAPWTQLYIGSNGDVSVCPRIHKYVVIGNILKQDMQQILTSPAILSLQQQMQERRFTNPVCGICVENLETRQAINQGF